METQWQQEFCRVAVPYLPRDVFIFTEQGAEQEQVDSFYIAKYKWMIEILP
jgi:hypothetical protein